MAKIDHCIFFFSFWIKSWVPSKNSYYYRVCVCVFCFKIANTLMHLMWQARVDPSTHESNVVLKFVEMDLPSIDCCSMVDMKMETEIKFDWHWAFDDDPIDSQTMIDQWFRPIDALISILFQLYHHLGYSNAKNKFSIVRFININCTIKSGREWFLFHITY